MNVKTLTLPASPPRTRRACYGLALVAMLLPFSLQADEQVQDPDAIRRTAENYALQQADLDIPGVTDISAEANNIDPRLRLAACDSALQAFSMTPASGNGRTTVGVRCLGPKPWTLYVPVQVHAVVQAWSAARTLVRGDSPGPDDLEQVEIPLSRLPANYLSDTSELETRELARNVQPGDLLTVSMFRARELIKRGQEVIILASTPGIEVKMAGVAMENGVLGELINVQNTNSGRTIQAVVRDTGTVFVKL